MDDVVEFKSIPHYFGKEKSGLKNNTVRKLDGITDDRYRLLVMWGVKKKYGKIRIVNTETKESFERQIRDISLWEDLWIITWDEE